ncbi:hypothetical protein V500_04591 [Pseudogymnoascus sp. VKM F-4518 (FW-2643)]|nr:hypothetical protein V500_04591 [Pseudogymnoascus sp. VKM F-4518 (FW-2643)]
MDSSPPRANEEWPTPSRRTSRVLRRYAHLSYRQIERTTGIPKSTVHRHTHYNTSRTYRHPGGITQDDYLRDILKGWVEPTFSEFWNQRRILQEDNDGAHGTKTYWNPCAQFKKDKRINLLHPWPPQSPDLSPIENCWRILKSRVRKRQARDDEELKAYLLKEWDKSRKKKSII